MQFSLELDEPSRGQVDVLGSIQRLVLHALLMAFSTWLKPSADPMAMLDICLFSSAARSAARDEASLPMTEQSSAGVCICVPSPHRQ